MEGCLDSSASAGGRTDLLKQLGRCHTLNMLKISCGDLQKYWSSKVDAPRMEHLVIVSNEQDPLSSEVPFILSDSHLHAPSLRRLELECCGIDWGSAFLTRLTHLGLDELPVNSLLECRDFIKALANIPFLEDIFLNFNYIRNEDTVDPPFFDSIPSRPYWHHLRCLEMTDNVLNIARFLKNIILPPMTKLDLNTYDCLPEARPNLPFVFDWISNYFKQPVGDDVSGSSDQKCVRSFILREFEDEFSIQAFNEVVHLDGEIEATHALFLFNLQNFRNVDLFGDVVEHLFLPLLPISSIVFLDVSIWSFKLSTADWLTIFGSIRTLESIRLSAVGSMPFFQALLPDPSNSQLLPFKLLKSISVFYLPTIVFQVIAYVLLKRSELGMRLEEFVFFFDEISLPPYSAISQLTELVSSVGVFHDLDYPHLSLTVFTFPPMP
jgi:hypothetical protein